MKVVKENWKLWVFYFTLIISGIIVYKALDSLGNIIGAITGFFEVISPFLIGILLAYLLYIPVSKIEKLYIKSKNKILLKKCRALSILTTYIIALILVVILMNVILPVVLDSVNELVNNFQEYYTIAIQKYNELPEDSVLKTEVIQKIVNTANSVDIKQYINVDKILGYIKGAFSVANGIFDAFVSLVVSIYILAERREIIRFLRKLCFVTFKEETYQKIRRYFNNTNDIFFKFLSSQFIDAILVGILSSIAMRIIGVKYAIMLGFMIGLFNMIPYFGAIIAIIIATLLTLITGGISQAVVMLIVIIILQQIDANVINPKITGDSLKISPLLVIFAVTIGGAYFGIMGMFLGVPVIAVIKIFINEYIENKLKN